MVRLERCIGLGAAALAALAIAAGCGGDDSAKSDSFASIASSISKPTGTVDETTAGKVGKEFEKTSAAGQGAASAFGGVREDAQVGATSSGSYTYSCEAGGTISASGTANSNGDGSQASGVVEEHLNHCCYSAGCCADGSAKIYFSSDQASNYSYCMNIDVDASCDGDSYSGTFAGCIGEGGSWVYSIDVDGKTYAVSGDYASGSGTLKIQGANGSWDCTYSNGSGSCTGPSGSFSFSAG